MDETKRSRPAPTRRLLTATILATAVATIFAALPGALAAEERQSVLSGPLLAETRTVAPEGLTTLVPYRRRTPAGFLYPWPLAPQPFHGDALRLRASAELGWLFERGDDHEARFGEYADLADGLLLQRFSLEGRQPEGLFHFALEGGSLARDDGFYRLEVGRAGQLRLRARHDSLPHVYADDARILFGGIGSENLRLPESLIPGASPRTDLTAALASVGERRIVQSREHSSVELRARIRPDLVWRSDYRLDRRHGERPFGGTLGTTFASANSGSVVELLEPIQSRTHDFTTALEFARPSLQANLRYRASLFDNRRESLTWENPFPATDLGFLIVPGEPLGRAALSPDNSSHQLSGDVAVSLPLTGRLTLSGAFTRMAQDERLLPATINGDLAPIALPRARAGARVDTWRLQSKLRARPIAPLDLHLDLRAFARDGDTNYTAFDPESGSYGYVVEDLASTGRVGAPPFSHRRIAVDTGGDWRLTRKSKLALAWLHEETQRSNRARRLTRDDRLRAAFSTRAPAQGTLRFSYEHQRRTGSDYDPARDAAYYAAAPFAPGLAGPARSLAPFRQLDLARHQGHELEARTNWGLGSSLDLALTTRLRTRDFGSDYGVRDEHGAEIGVDASYLPSPRFEGHLFASWERRDRRLRTIDSAPGPVSDLAAGGATFPYANTWSWDSQTDTIATGSHLTLRPTRRLELELDYRLLHSRERVETDFARDGGALSGGVDPATALARYVPERLIDHVLTLSGTRRWSDTISTTLLYRLHDSTIEDAHQTTLEPLVNQNLYLAAIDDDFRVHLVALTAKLRY